MATIVTIARYKQHKTAYFLKERLEKADIDCFFAKSGRGEESWDEVRVQVQDSEVEKAVKIMLGIREEFGKPIEEIDPSKIPLRILVPTDFSRASEHAGHYAIHMAHKINAEIKLLHVYPNPVGTMGVRETATYLDYVNSTMAEAEKRVNTGALDFLQKMKSYMYALDIEGVRVHSALVMGQVLPQIKSVAKSYSPDFIVLGTGSQSGDAMSVVGGLADALIHGMDIPVFAIPGDCTRKDFKTLKIVYATDFNEKDHHSLENLLRFTSVFEKEVNCIHIDTDRNPANSERMEELNLQLKRDYSDHNIHCKLIEDKDIFNGIRVFADTSASNLLSFTVKKRGVFDKLFKPNLFRKILQEFKLPILLFPS